MKRQAFRLGLAMLLLVLWTGVTAAQTGVPPEVEQSLALAGKNRASLEAVLAEYERSGEREKYAAACYLVAHMRWHSQGGRVERYDARLDSCWRAATEAYLGLTRGHTLDELGRKPLRKLLNDTASAMRRTRQAMQLEAPEVRAEEMPDVQTLDGDFVWITLSSCAAARRGRGNCRSMTSARMSCPTVPSGHILS